MRNYMPVRTRASITWRIPIDILERVDRLRQRTGLDRTATVVEALEQYLARKAKHARTKHAR